MIMSRNVVKTDRPQMAIWRLAAGWISKATLAPAQVSTRTPTPTGLHTHTHTHTNSRARTRIHTYKYVRLIIFLRQQWSRKRASLLHLHVHCLSCFCKNAQNMFCSKNCILYVQLYKIPGNRLPTKCGPLTPSQFNIWVLSFTQPFSFSDNFPKFRTVRKT